MPKPSVRRVLRWVGLGALALFVAIQFVPYGWRHSNPPVTQSAPWPDPAAEAIARESCYDCHSNETNWRWYSFVAPMSWLVRQDVEEGREKLNFSTWDTGPGGKPGDTNSRPSRPWPNSARCHRRTRTSGGKVHTTWVMS